MLVYGSLLVQHIPTEIEHSYNIQVIFVPTGRGSEKSSKSNCLGLFYSLYFVADVPYVIYKKSMLQVF